MRSKRHWSIVRIPVREDPVPVLTDGSFPEPVTSRNLLHVPEKPSADSSLRRVTKRSKGVGAGHPELLRHLGRKSRERDPDGVVEPDDGGHVPR